LTGVIDCLPDIRVDYSHIAEDHFGFLESGAGGASQGGVADQAVDPAFGTDVVDCTIREVSSDIFGLLGDVKEIVGRPAFLVVANQSSSGGKALGYGFTEVDILAGVSKQPALVFEESLHLDLRRIVAYGSVVVSINIHVAVDLLIEEDSLREAIGKSCGGGGWAGGNLVEGLLISAVSGG
jgi:hypothetical protein